ncbi:MAG: helix-turn-helix transcriptional regulator [Ruminococcus sp.]|nr:helix-turn-helix transcriptional regulator [Ruminococcus sp.]
MFIYQLGWHWRHPADFVIERPNGHFGTQVILVQSKGRLKMGGTEYIVDKNTAFLVKNCLPHCIYGYEEEYVDDWIRFSLEQKDVDFIAGLKLEYNVPVKLRDDSVSKLIAAAVEIFDSEVPNKNETLHHILTAILLHMSEYAAPVDKKKRNYYDDKLDSLRGRIFQHPSENWNIPDLAAELNISVSHFQRLYKQKYGISCMNDVFMSRMEYAKQLLMNTELTAAEIAEMCGYQNYEYFSRSFVKYACVSPTKYRNKFKEN